MLVLDQAVSASLLAVAASEQLVRHASDPGALYNDPATSSFLAKGTDRKLRKQALWDLLLHYPAVLSPFDNLDVTELQKLGLVDGQVGMDSQAAAYSQLRDAPEVVRGIQGIILAELGAAHPAIVADGAADTFLRLRASRGYRVANQLDSAMFDMFDTFDEYIAGAKAMFGGDVFRSPGRGGRQVSGAELGAAIAAAANRDDFLAFKAYQPYRDFMNDFSSSAQRWLALTGLSRSLGAVMSASMPKALLNPNPVPPQGGFHEALRTGADRGGTHAAVRIWLEEVRCAPRLRTIGDVLQLREDRRIGAFREAMQEWTESLASGSPAEEARLRKSIGTANKEMAKLPAMENVSRCWTFASIPLDIFLALYMKTDIPTPVTGLIGIAMLAATDAKMRSLDWVMFGSISGSR